MGRNRRSIARIFQDKLDVGHIKIEREHRVRHVCLSNKSVIAAKLNSNKAE